MSSAQPGVDWELSSYDSFLDWIADLIHISYPSYITDIRVLFVTLSGEMERLGQPCQNPEDDEEEQLVVRALEGADARRSWVKIVPPVRSFSLSSSFFLTACFDF